AARVPSRRRGRLSAPAAAGRARRPHRGGSPHGEPREAAPRGDPDRLLDRTRAPRPGARSGSDGAGGGGATAGGGADAAGARSLTPSGAEGGEGRGALDRGRSRS